MRPMLSPKTILLAALVLIGLAFLGFWVGQARRRQRGDRAMPDATQTGIGFVTNFFDTLGIGSFATTTSIYRLLGLVPDEDIPGTLNVGHTFPTLLQAWIYTQIVEVDPKTLVLLIVSAVAGSWLGASVVASWPRRNIQVGMGLALLAAAVLMVLSALN